MMICRWPCKGAFFVWFHWEDMRRVQGDANALIVCTVFQTPFAGPGDGEKRSGVKLEIERAVYARKSKSGAEARGGGEGYARCSRSLEARGRERQGGRGLLRLEVQQAQVNLNARWRSGEKKKTAN